MTLSASIGMEAAKIDSAPTIQDDLEQTNTIQVDTVQFLSTNGAVMTIIKCAIGAGSFSLPKAFMDGGVYLSFFFTVFLGILSAYTLLILIQCSLLASEMQLLIRESKFLGNEVEHTEDLTPKMTGYNSVSLSDDYISNGDEIDIIVTEMGHLTYPEIGAIAFPEADFSFYGFECNLAHWIITVGILMTSLGVCAAYVDFISDTLPVVLKEMLGDSASFLNRTNTPWFIMPIILSLSFLRTMKVLTYTSLVGNIAVFAGCLGVIIYGYLVYSQSITLQHNFIEWKTLPRYIGGNTFLFAIHVAILPIMQEMDNTDSDNSKHRAIARSFSFITLFNALFGFIGYLLFASSECKNVVDHYVGPCDNVLSNMSGGNVLNSVKVLVCIDLLFTVPLILAASRVIIEKAVFESETVQHYQKKWFDQNLTMAAPGNVDSITSKGEVVNRKSKASEENLLNSGITFATMPSNLDTTQRSHVAMKVESEVTTEDSFDTDTVYEKVETAKRRLYRKLDTDSNIVAILVQYAVRTTLVATVILMAISIPHFGDMVDLVGGLVMPLTCFLLPSAMFVRLRHHFNCLLLMRNRNTPDAGYRSDDITSAYQKKGSLSRFVYAKHLLIMIFGIMTMISTIVLSAVS